MRDGPRPVSVIIVGAGPVGLALANELGYRGVDYIVVDEGDGGVPFPAGEALFSRTMEHLRRWGIADDVRYGDAFPKDLPFTIGFGTALTGHLLTTIDGPSNAAMPAASRISHPKASPSARSSHSIRSFAPVPNDSNAGRFAIGLG